MQQDSQWMQHALNLAERGRGFVEPNPLVGAVVVRNDVIVGEGWHQRFGKAHAEIHALNQAGEQAQNATLYVTLEPCCHQGKTPPCTDAVLKSGIHRVVVGMVDPFPRVSGGGVAILRQAGVTVDVGLLESEAKQLNCPYLKLLQSGRPYLHLKWAMSLDGKIATRTGDSQWISNEASRQQVHQLRGRMDAILVGLGTVLADDPKLTARPPGPRVATRIVLDSHGRTPLDCNLVQTASEIPTLLATLKPNPKLEDAGCEVLTLPEVNGRPSITALLDELGRRRMTNLLVEGGAHVLGSFLDERQADELHIYVGPKLIGGVESPSPVGGLGIAKLSEGLSLKHQSTLLEGDVYIHAVIDHDSA